MGFWKLGPGLNDRTKWPRQIQEQPRPLAPHFTGTKTLRGLSEPLRSAQGARLGQWEAAARLHSIRLQGPRPFPRNVQPPLAPVPTAGEAGRGRDTSQLPKQPPRLPAHILEGPASVALGAACAVSRSVRRARAC